MILLEFRDYKTRLIVVSHISAGKSTLNLIGQEKYTKSHWSGDQARQSHRDYKYPVKMDILL